MLRLIIEFVLFAVSTGVFFNEQFRKNRLAVLAGGSIALASSVALFFQIVDLTKAPATPPASAPSASIPGPSADEIFWLAIKESAVVAFFDEFLAKFPTSRHISDAVAIRDELKRKQIATTSPPNLPLSLGSGVESPAPLPQDASASRGGKRESPQLTMEEVKPPTPPTLSECARDGLHRRQLIMQIAVLSQRDAEHMRLVGDLIECGGLTAAIEVASRIIVINERDGAFARIVIASILQKTFETASDATAKIIILQTRDTLRRIIIAELSRKPNSSPAQRSPSTGPHDADGGWTKISYGSVGGALYNIATGELRDLVPCRGTPCQSGRLHSESIEPVNGFTFSPAKPE